MCFWVYLPEFDEVILMKKKGCMNGGKKLNNGDDDDDDGVGGDDGYNLYERPRNCHCSIKKYCNEKAFEICTVKYEKKPIQQ